MPDCIFIGTTCETNINECHSSPCLHNATCEDLIGGYECICLPGFTGESCQLCFLQRGRPQSIH